MQKKWHNRLQHIFYMFDVRLSIVVACVFFTPRYLGRRWSQVRRTAKQKAGGLSAEEISELSSLQATRAAMQTTCETKIAALKAKATRTPEEEAELRRQIVEMEQRMTGLVTYIKSKLPGNQDPEGLKQKQKQKQKKEK